MTADEAEALQRSYADQRRCWIADLPARLGPFAEQTAIHTIHTADISTRVPDPQDREAA